MKRVLPYKKRAQKPLGARLIEELIVRSWWVFAFFILSFCCFKPIFKHLSDEEARLLNVLGQLESKKLALSEAQEHLKLQLESQKDPLWVEMILKKELGLVSEGQTKVRFINPS